jgi:hypothetical protein
VRRPVAALGCAALLGVLAGCAGAAAGPPSGVTVETGGRTVPLEPTQYCLDDEAQRYAVTPPIIDVAPGTPIELAVPDEVAERGWSVQVFDDQLETRIGDVDVDAGTEVFDVNSSDVAPATFYLVVVEDASSDCEGLSGAWPVGFIRAGGPIGGTAPAG